MTMKLTEIQDLCDGKVRAEALARFGFDREGVEELEGSSVVLKGRIGGEGAVLKLSPAWHEPPEPTIGAEPAQIAAEMDFVLHLAKAGAPVARPVPSLAGNLTEALEVGENACLVASVTELAPGEMFPDDDEVHFPPEAVVEWGRVQGLIARLSEAYRPSPGLPWRLDWSHDGNHRLEDFLRGPDPEVLKVRDSILAELRAMDQAHDRYGTVHGDFHHGNFLWDGSRLTVFDFDGAHLSWFESEPAVSLYNCLPMPRDRVEARRTYSLGFLRLFLEGYRRERPFGPAEAARIPLWLKYYELCSYGYCLKYFAEPLSERRKALLKTYRSRLVGGVPVVEFGPGDLESLG